MQSSISWIEWLDRLDRVLKGAREDVRTLAGLGSPEAVAAVERCKRQISALTDDLRLLDRSVLSAKSDGALRSAAAISDRASNLQSALDTAVFHLGAAASAAAVEFHATRERMLTAIDSALRDSCYEAAMLLRPARPLPERRASFG